MKTSFESAITHDVLAGHQNGYDGRLKGLTMSVDVARDCLTARVILNVVWGSDGSGDWSQVEINFSKIAFTRIKEGWFVGGGCVLYNGARLLSANEELILDLDPGVAWLSPEASRGGRRESEFLIVGTGTVLFSPMNSGTGGLGD